MAVASAGPYANRLHFAPDVDPQSKFFGIYGWLAKIYGCFVAKLEKHIMENLRLKLHAGFNIPG